MNDNGPVEEALLESEALAHEFLRLAGRGEMPKLTALASDIYSDRPHLLPMVMGVWHAWARDAYGPQSVHDLVEKIVLNIADAPVDEPRTRGVFCDMLFAMEDDNSGRVLQAWELLMEHGGWDTAVEVLSLFLGFAAYFMGWIPQE